MDVLLLFNVEMLWRNEIVVYYLFEESWWVMDCIFQSAKASEQIMEWVYEKYGRDRSNEGALSKKVPGTLEFN